MPAPPASTPAVPCPDKTGDRQWSGPAAWTPPLLLTTAAYLLLSVFVAGQWTYGARTEADVEKLDEDLPSGHRLSSRFCSVVRMAEGNAWAPFVKRRLLVDLARGLAAVVPEGAWSRLAEWIDGPGAGAAWARAQMHRLSWKSEHLPLLLCATLLIYLSVVGFMFACRWLALVLYDGPGWVADAAGAVLGVALLGGMTDWHYCAYPYDFPNAFVFTLTLTAILARRWWFVLAFAAAAYSKETSILLIAAYVLVAQRRWTVGFWGVLGLMAAMYAGLRGWIETQYPLPVGDFWFPDRNYRCFRILAFYGWFAPFMGVALARLVAARRLYPPVLKKLCLLGIPLVGLAFFKGWIEELRQYMEMLPIMGLIVIQWVLHESGVGGLLTARASARTRGSALPKELTPESLSPAA